MCPSRTARTKSSATRRWGPGGTKSSATRRWGPGGAGCSSRRGRGGPRGAATRRWGPGGTKSSAALRWGPGGRRERNLQQLCVGDRGGRNLQQLGVGDLGGRNDYSLFGALGTCEYFVRESALEKSVGNRKVRIYDADERTTAPSCWRFRSHPTILWPLSAFYCASILRRELLSCAVSCPASGYAAPPRATQLLIDGMRHLQRSAYSRACSTTTPGCVGVVLDATRSCGATRPAVRASLIPRIELHSLPTSYCATIAATPDLVYRAASATWMLMPSPPRTAPPARAGCSYLVLRRQRELDVDALPTSYCAASAS